MITKFKDHKNSIVSIDDSTIKRIDIFENKIVIEYNDNRFEILQGISKNYKTFTEEQFKDVKQFFEDLKTVI